MPNQKRTRKYKREVRIRNFERRARTFLLPRDLDLNTIEYPPITF